MPRGDVDITQADMEDARTRVTFHLQVSGDGGQTWTTAATGTFEGGVQTQKNGVTPAWGMTVEDTGRHAGKMTRFVTDRTARPDVR